MLADGHGWPQHIAVARAGGDQPPTTT